MNIPFQKGEQSYTYTELSLKRKEVIFDLTIFSRLRCGLCLSNSYLIITGVLFEGADGYFPLSIDATTGDLEILVWSQQTLAIALTKRHPIGPSVVNETLELQLEFDFNYSPLVRVMVRNYLTFLISRITCVSILLWIVHLPNVCDFGEAYCISSNHIPNKS